MSYSILPQDVEECVRKAEKQYTAELAAAEARYEIRRGLRAGKGIPVVALLGAGDSGKDTVAKILRRECRLTYVGSISRAVAPLIARSLQLPLETVYARRQDMRDFWFAWISEFCKNDPTRAIRLQLADNDICVGVRGRNELLAGLDAGIIQHVVWLKRPGKEDGKHDVDEELVMSLGGRLLDNSGSLQMLVANTISLARELGYGSIEER